MKYEDKENYLIGMTVEDRKKHLNATLFKELKDYNGKNTLYLGCNNGTSTILLSQYCDNLVGCDINKSAIEHAILNTQLYNIDNISYDVCNIINLPYNDNQFDCIYAFHILEHLFPKDLNKSLKEIKRILKPKGYFLIEFPHPKSINYKDKEHMIFFENEKYINKIIGKYFKIKKIIYETRTNPGLPGKHNNWRVICQNL